MSRDLSTSGHLIDLGTDQPSTGSFTFAFWFKPNWSLGFNLDAGFVPNALLGDTTGTKYFIIGRRTTNVLNVGTRNHDGTSDQVATFTIPSGQPALLNAGKWHHMAWCGSPGAFFLNGTQLTPDAGTFVPSIGFSSPQGFQLGAGCAGFISGVAANGNANGTFAEAAVWGVHLQDSQIAALARGVSPWLMQPADLYNYWPLWGLQSPEPNFIAGRTAGTLTGTSQADGPPVAPFLQDLWRVEFPYTPTVSGSVAFSPLRIDAPLLAPTSIGGGTFSPSLKIDLPLLAPTPIGGGLCPASPLKADLPLVGPTPTGGGQLAASPLAVQIPLAIAPQAGGILSLSPLEWDLSLLAPTAASAGDPLRPGGGRLARAGNVGTFRRASARGSFTRQELAAGGRFAHAGQTGTLERAGAVGRLERKCLP